MAERLKPADVVVIGLGAAGGMAVLPMAKAGLEIVALEAGPRYTYRDFPSDEIRNDHRNWLGSPKFNHEIPTWRLSASAPAIAPPFSVKMANGVGGTSIHYGMESWRHRPWTFQAYSESVARYGKGSIPADSTYADWPISYADLEPWYALAEHIIGVSGKAGNIKGKIDPRGNIHEGPRSAEYPNPPLRRSGWTELTDAAARKLGWHPFPGPASILSREYHGQPSCQYCGFCTYNGCHNNAKGSTFLNSIPQAEKTGHLHILTRSRVTAITVDANGKANGVDFVRAGRTYHQPAKLVVLSSYIYENNRLLLLSTSKAFPNGLSNNHGQVGRNFMSHMYGGVNALFPGKRLNLYGPGAQRTTIDDFTDDEFDHTGLGFVGGGVIDARMEWKPIAGATTVPPGVPGWGSAWKDWIHKNALSVGGIGTQIECLPYEGNFLDLDPTTKDPHGVPVVRVTFNIGQQEVLRYQHLQTQAELWAKEAGASDVWASIPPIPIAVNSHAYGGTRMGNDPSSSVVDKWSLSHEVPNLAVLGGSTFVTTGNHNPTETIEALALRTGDHIAKHWKSLTT
jgi:gluconate 2-dehydrogenase alpha chain